MFIRGWELKWFRKTISTLMEMHRSNEINSDGSENCEMSNISHILRNCIENAEYNFGKSTNGVRYSDTCRFFHNHLSCVRQTLL